MKKLSTPSFFFTLLLVLHLLYCGAVRAAPEGNPLPEKAAVLSVKVSRSKVLIGTPLEFSLSLGLKGTDSVYWDTALFPETAIILQEKDGLNNPDGIFRHTITFTSATAETLILPSLPVLIYSKGHCDTLYSDMKVVYFNSVPLNASLFPIQSDAGTIEFYGATFRSVLILLFLLFLAALFLYVNKRMSLNEVRMEEDTALILDNNRFRRPKNDEEGHQTVKEERL